VPESAFERGACRGESQHRLLSSRVQKRCVRARAVRAAPDRKTSIVVTRTNLCCRVGAEYTRTCETHQTCGSSDTAAHKARGKTIRVSLVVGFTALGVAYAVLGETREVHRKNTAATEVQVL
jgi:hypothetical protein